MLLLYFPTYVSFHLKGLNRVRGALLIACGHPLHVMGMGLGLYGLQMLYMFIPGLILFFAAAVSLICFPGYPLVSFIDETKTVHTKRGSDTTVSLSQRGVRYAKHCRLRPKQQGAHYVHETDHGSF